MFQPNPFFQCVFDGSLSAVELSQWIAGIIIQPDEIRTFRYFPVKKTADRMVKIRIIYNNLLHSIHISIFQICNIGRRC